MLVLLVWDSSCAIAEIKDRLISEVLSSVEKFARSQKNTPIGGVWDFKAVTVPTQSTMLRGKSGNAFGDNQIEFFR